MFMNWRIYFWFDGEFEQMWNVELFNYLDKYFGLLYD